MRGFTDMWVLAIERQLVAAQPPLPATTAGMILAVGCAIAAAIAVYRTLSRRAAAHRTMQAIAAGGLTFQVVHVLEHVLQLSFWFTKPDGKPWLSAWAAGTADGLQYFCSLVPLADAPPSLGVEMLHLTGNVIFLGALTAWQIAMRASNRTIRTLDIAEKIQLFHVAEHVLLVGTLLMFDKAIGISTAFGAAEGTSLVALRVWFHFSINAIATVYAIRAARTTWITPLPSDDADSESNQESSQESGEDTDEQQVDGQDIEESELTPTAQ